MKPEPLKNKTQNFENERCLFHYDGDIKSAVEWLKELLNEQDNEGNVYFDYKQLCNMINEAFEDVTKNEKMQTK